jgi:hypothetical protein
MAPTGQEALQFFVEKVVTEAALQHMSLSVNPRSPLMPLSECERM